MPAPPQDVPPVFWGHGSSCHRLWHGAGHRDVPSWLWVCAQWGRKGVSPGSCPIATAPSPAGNDGARCRQLEGVSVVLSSHGAARVQGCTGGGQIGGCAGCAHRPRPGAHKYSPPHPPTRTRSSPSVHAHPHASVRTCPPSAHAPRCAPTRMCKPMGSTQPHGSARALVHTRHGPGAGFLPRSSSLPCRGSSSRLLTRSLRAALLHPAATWQGQTCPF